ELDFARVAGGVTVSRGAGEAGRKPVSLRDSAPPREKLFVSTRGREMTRSRLSLMMSARIFAALMLLAIAPLRADDPPKLKGEIVVTPERGAAERDSVAASVTVITREQLDKLPAQSLAEVVNGVPGITMDFDTEAAGAPMITSRGFFGGGENEYVKLLVDGVPAGDVESGLIDWRHIRTADIERIEVLRGPGSSLYGDSAMGGVISVFTRGAAPGSGAQGEVRLTGGTLGTRDAGVNFRDDLGPLRLGIDALNTSTDGYRDHSAS